ncbi:MAG: alpha-galactosidase [Ruminococcaceae bacterium]|nr:alpha-galactosidase [Oscillospiraceae bacterium]
MNVIKKDEKVLVYANIESTCDIEKVSLGEKITEYTFSLKWNEDEAKKSDLNGVEIRYVLPLTDAAHFWTPNCRTKRIIDAEWRTKNQTMMTIGAPVACVFNEDEKNRYTFASSETKKITSLEVGVDEHTSSIFGKLKIGLKQYTNISEHKVKILLIENDMMYYEALDYVRAWWEKDITPMAVPSIAKMPVYSSWYNFHQHITDEKIEKECTLANELGLKSIIVDDGWQTDDTNCGYAFCGDWEVTPSKIKDMKTHVENVHKAGLKYILWFSIPFVGYKSKAWERFKNKIIYKIDRLNAGVLDPRYPDVREYLINIYENALKNYNLDGFKLDFIDRFTIIDENKITDEMDYVCVQEAADRLMTDVKKRLTAIKEDVLIEFRQSYIGPDMRKYANMFRVNDCPNDFVSNRIGICDLRLISGSTAVHSDMLMWNDEETSENAAKQILNSIFGVIQLSKKLETMKENHKKMTSFWINFAIKNKKVLLDSSFVAYEPQNLYPVIKAFDEKDEIIAVYSKNKVINPDLNKNVKIINATSDDVIYVKSDAQKDINVCVKTCEGETYFEGKISICEGVNCIKVPVSGLIEF